MQWICKPKPMLMPTKPTGVGDERWQWAFAFWPIKCQDDYMVWLDWYQIREQFTEIKCRGKDRRGYVLNPALVYKWVQAGNYTLDQWQHREKY